MPGTVISSLRLNVCNYSQSIKRDYPLCKTNTYFMNLVRKRIKNIIKNMKEERNNNVTSDKEYVFLELTISYKEFFSKCSSIGDFMKKLKNGKISFPHTEDFGRPKQNNREYFNDLIGEGGFYRYEISDKVVNFDIFFQIKRDFDERIDKDIIVSRINKIISPLNISIEVGDKTKLRNKLENLSQLNIGWNVFGSEYRKLEY